MQNKFTQKAQNTLNRAAAEAGALGHTYIGSEHMLLALSLEKDSIASRILFARGISPGFLRGSITELAGEGERCHPAPCDMTPRAKKIIEESGSLARKKGCTYIGTEHLLAALLAEDGSMGVRIIESSGVPRSLLLGDLSAHQSSFGNSKKESREPKDNDGAQIKTKAKTPPILEKYSFDMTEAAATGKLEPTVGRDAETERIIRILSRKTKNNPCLVGEPGVGKTAVVEGLARRIAEGKVPQRLDGKRILCLDITSMIAGAKYRGEFEERMKSVMAETVKNPDIILFIDEMHVIIGGGAAEGAIDAANILKPALARGGIRVIGATTTAEYRKHIERDAALERRFQSVVIEEPSQDDATAILKGIRGGYETHHSLKITDAAIEAAVRLSARYIHDRFLPDKAIDVIDEAAAKAAIAAGAAFPDTAELKKQLDQVKQERQNCIESQDFDRAAELRERETDLKARLDAVRKEQRARKNKGLFTVDEEQVADVIMTQTGIPVSRLLGDESAALLELEEKMNRRVIGQQSAVSAVANAIRRGRVGLRDPNRPTGSFIFLGKTGVGKTELARCVAEEVMGSRDALIRFDMSEYMEKHSVSKLIGSPPGYVGYGEGGRLTEAVRRRPYSVVLFDEIEKAHSDVFDLLLQVLEDGRLTDSQGRTVNFCNTMIIMTSNAGASDRTRISGFGSPDASLSTDRERMMSSLKTTFKPEFLGRVDEIVVFNDLDLPALEQIAASLLAELSSRAAELGYSITFDRSVASMVALKNTAEGCGARNIRRTVIKTVEDRISREILRGNLVPNKALTLTATPEHLVFPAS
ncbi:MAG: ATP-dependent Clp protease ATP-binding subunit [Clostridia bacterium]|nr:ATP-dependent Clp protease ATP-binding subunit [Clostridia bacterium]